MCEGLAARDANAFSVQHHPEAGPGPHDSRYLFARFADRMTGTGVAGSGRRRRSPPLVERTDPPGCRMPDRAGVA